MATKKTMKKTTDAVEKTAPMTKETLTEEKKIAEIKVTAKTEDKPAEKKPEEKPAEKKPAEKKLEEKPAEKKVAAKKPAAKKAVKKTELQSALHVQFAGKSYAQEDLMKMAKDVWKYDLKQKARDLVSVELYVKPEENMVYYVMNKEFTGGFYI